MTARGRVQSLGAGQLCPPEAPCHPAPQSPRPVTNMGWQLCGGCHPCPLSLRLLPPLPSLPLPLPLALLRPLGGCAW
eukprot:1847463-Alexandrium_andersonii.AAC.1